MTTRIKTLVLASAAAAGLAGCSTIIKGTTQDITFASVPPQAGLTIDNRAGQRVYSGATPATVSLKRGSGFFKAEHYYVTIAKPGYAPQKLELYPGVNGWYFANLLFGGVIGMLIVDPATGAMYTLSPEQVNVTLAANGLSFAPGERAVTVVTTTQVPASAMQTAQPLPVPPPQPLPASQPVATHP